ncbi:MAG TPA: ATP-binding protein [Bdellovibrionota bacterium]
MALRTFFSRWSPQEERVKALFESLYLKIAQKLDMIFGSLLLVQWVCGICLAYFVSPRAWEGELAPSNLHLHLAIFGGALAAFPAIYLALRCPGRKRTRYAITVAQMLFSTLFIHLTHGRAATHFHVFGSIAFIAFYRDWKLVALASALTSIDHFTRGAYWPESVYGIASATPWRAVEHSAWLAFVDIVLVFAIDNAIKDLWSVARKQVGLENAVHETKLANRNATTQRSALDTFAIVSITDANDRITHVNDNFCHLTKYSREEILGNTHKLFNSGQHSKGFFEELWKTVSSGQVWEGDIQNKAKDGSLFWVDTSIVPIKDEQGNVREYVSVRKDITYKKYLESFVAEMNQSLEKKVEERTLKWIEAESRLTQTSKMSSLGEMAAGVAHEINNPLATIKTVSGQLAEILSEKPLDEELAVSMAQSIAKTTDRIAKIVLGLRTFSRDGSSDPFIPVNVSELVNETASFCQERFRNNGIEFRIDTIDEKLRFDGRATQISQILLNLLNNSFDAIAKQPGAKWIAISAMGEDEFVEIRVSDSGQGIPKDIQKKIFQPYFTTKEIGKGTGMGLSISLGIVTAHHGTLALDSSSEHTCFLIRIPKKQGNERVA